MGYELIDSVIQAWAATHRLYLYKEYKEIEVRSVESRTGSGKGYQIWIDEPDQCGLVGIHVWNFKRVDRGGRRLDFLVSPSDLREYLESALLIANGWIGQSD